MRRGRCEDGGEGERGGVWGGVSAEPLRDVDPVIDL